MRERNRLLRDEVRDAGWYRALESQMADMGAAMTRNRQDAIARITAAQEGAETRFPPRGWCFCPARARPTIPDPASIAARWPTPGAATWRRAAP